MGLPILFHASIGLLSCILFIAYRVRSCPPWLANMRGPSRAHFFFGNLKDIADNDPDVTRWIEEYGGVIKCAGLFGSPRLLVADFAALNYILQHGESFHKPSHVREMLARMLGRGVLVMEGEQHRMQRKALNPAFGIGQARDLTGIFLDKANQLRDVLTTLVATSDTTIDIVTSLSQCTLDIIGLAGFGYSFNALSHEAEPSELSVAFEVVMHTVLNSYFLNLLEWIFPFLRALPTKRNRKMREALQVMDHIGRQLIQERKAAAALEASHQDTPAARSRDLLSLLVRANTATDARQRMSDEDVLGQVPTFLVAGHETTATLLSWIFFRLSLNPDIQSALRNECRANPLPTGAQNNDALDADQLASLDRLPLLDAIVRETLRLDAPVGVTDRIAATDVVLPLDEPLIDRTGQMQKALAVPKGTVVTIPMHAINTLERIWGPDAKSWNPDRWMAQSLPEASKRIPGVYGNIMSFLGGSRACIGYRVSLYETKIIMHALICQFDFRLAVPEADIGRKWGIVTRPFSKSQTEAGTQLPLVINKVID